MLWMSLGTIFEWWIFARFDLHSGLDHRPADSLRQPSLAVLAGNETSFVQELGRGLKAPCSALLSVKAREVHDFRWGQERTVVHLDQFPELFASCPPTQLFVLLLIAEVQVVLGSCNNQFVRLATGERRRLSHRISISLSASTCRRFASSGLRVPRLRFSSRFPSSARRSSGTRLRSQYTPVL